MAELVEVLGYVNLAAYLALAAVALRYGSAPFRVEAAREGDHVVVAVQDGGRGVPSEFVPQLFERFTRSDGSRAVRGTGLGLAIARAYALAHGGDLRYVPATPHGARFEFVLPSG